MKKITLLLCFSFLVYLAFTQNATYGVGNYTITVPPGVTSMTIDAYGAGGGGGNSGTTNAAGGGGGGGGYARKNSFAVTPNTCYTINVGGGGGGGGGGGASNFLNGASVIVQANGGGGAFSTNGFAAGGGGAGAVGDVLRTGGSGANGSGTTRGGGGGAAGTSGNGGGGSGTNGGGGGGGYAGAGGTNGGGGGNFGGAGSGGLNGGGAGGAQGLVALYYGQSTNYTYGSSGGAWNIYAYKTGDYGFADGNYGGSYTTGSSSTNAASFSQSDGNVSSGRCGVGQVQSIRALLNNTFTKSVYTIQIGSDDNFRFFINGGLTLNGTCCGIISTNVALDGNYNLEYQGNNTGGPGGYSTNIFAPAPASGSLSVSQACASNSGTLSWSGGFGYYQLESSTNNTTWGNANSENNTVAAATLSLGVSPSVTTFYRVRTTNGGSTVYSNVVAVRNSGGTTTGNVVISANITLGGTVNVNGNFTVNNGVTITVSDGCPLVVNADNIFMNGIIDANGAGNSGGGGGAGGQDCNPGSNPGGGGGGAGGGATGGTGNQRGVDCGFACIGGQDGIADGGGGGGAGGGGSYGGVGGAGKAGGNGEDRLGGGGFPSGGAGAAAAAASTEGNYTISLGTGGSGGGGAGGGQSFGGSGESGGRGGGAVSLIASNDLTVTGTISANGLTGGNGGQGNNGRNIDECGLCTYVNIDGAGGGGAGAGGGSGGGIYLQGFGAVSVTGALSANGGAGGSGGAGGGGAQSGNGGAGGGGGKIKIVSNPCESNTIAPSSQTTAGGGGGGGLSTGNGGGTGTYQNNIVHQSYSALSALTVSSSQSNICKNTQPAAITSSATSGGIGTYSYQWYSSTSTSTGQTGTGSAQASGWGAIAGATGATLTSAQMGNLTVNTNYQLRLNSGTCYTWSNVVSKILETTAPDISCPSNIAVNVNPSSCTGTASWIAPVGTDNCLGMTTAQVTSFVSGASTYPKGVTTITYRVTDAVGLTDQCSFTVTVTDNILPQISCPANIAVNVNPGTCEGTASWIAPAGTDNCPGMSTAQVTSFVSGASTYPKGVSTITYRVTDAVGLSASCSFTVTVTDNIPPVITSCPEPITQRTDVDQPYATVNTGTASATDNCSGVVTITSNHPSNQFAIGTNVVTWTATDIVGNSSTCTQIVQVNDVQAPNIECGYAPATVSNIPGTCGADVTFEVAYAADNSGFVTLTYLDKNNTNVSVTVPVPPAAHTTTITANFPVGQSTLFWTATDPSGNNALCTQLITVVDTESPVFGSCPSNILASTDPNTCAAIVNYTTPVGTDNCPGVVTNITNGLPSGGSFPLGSTTVTYVTTDASGNSSECSFVVTVEDLQVPVINCPGNISDNNSTGDCFKQIDYNTPVGSDNCLGSVTTMLNGLASGSNFPVGVTTVTYEVTGNGQSASCSFTVTISDVEAPVATTASCFNGDYIFVNNDLGQCTSSATLEEPEFSDNCGLNLSSLTLDNPGPYTIGENFVTWTIADINGNITACNQAIFVLDVDAPNIITCAPQTVSTDPGVCTANVSVITPDATDNCLNELGIYFYNDFTFTDNASETYPLGTTLVNWTVSDAFGNESYCTQAITVTDDTDPDIVCPSDIIVTTDAGVCSAIVSFDATATDNCTVTSVLQTSGITSGEQFPEGTSTVEFTATDNSNNTSTCTFTVTVNDEEPPIAICQDVTVQLDNTGNGSTTAVAVNNGSYDACGIASISISPSAFTCGHVGANTVVLTVTDIHSNVSTCSATVTVEDNENPTITCNAAVAVNNDLGVCGAVVNYINSSTDNCSGQTIAQTAGLSSGSTFPVGSTTNTFVVTDASGNTATCSFDVVVTDNEVPSITCSANQTQTSDAGLCSAAVTVVGPTTADNCNVATVVNNYNNTSNASGTYPVGTTSVVWTVTDIYGNTNNCTQTVTVTDNEAPIIVSCPLDRFASASIGNCYRQMTIAALTATDNCGILSITNSYNGTNNASGQYPVGITEVVWTVTDIHGNSSTCETFVLIVDNQPPVALCKNKTVNLNSSGFASIVPSDINNGSTDNCSIISYNLSNNIFTCSNTGTNNVTLTVIDAAGLVGTCNATVTVVDAIAPIALCQNVTVFLDANGNATVPASQVDNGSSDACGIATRSINNGSFTCANLGSANPVTLTVTDNNGNVSTCNATVTVIDNTAPIAICNNFTAALGANGQVTVTGLDFSGASTDNCTIANRQVNASSFTCANLGTNSVTVILTDQSGNNSYCFPTLTVIDNTAPVITCPADIVVNTDAGQCGAVVSFNATATDNCTVSSVVQSSGINSGTQFPVGTSTVGFTATDQSGNNSSCTFTVTVNDVEVPNAICQNVTVQLDATGNGSTTAALVNNGSNDACGIASLALNNSNFNCSNVGSGNTVVLTVTDNNGNVSTCSSTVTVVDGIAPVAICQDVTVNLDATGNGTTTAIAVNNGSSDACGIASLVLSQTAFNCSEVGANPETLTVTDVNGNVSTCATTVTVVDGIAPVAVCQNVTVQLDNSGFGLIIASQVDNGSSDACGIAYLDLSKSSFNCSNVGGNSVTLTVTDVNGNVSTCSATVTVVDAVAPVAVCQPVIVNLNAGGTGSTTAVAVNNGSSDACGIASLALSQTSFTCSNVGVNPVALTVTDVNGNVSTCSTTVTVVDAVAPVALCKNATVTLSASGTGSTTTTAINNGSTDACGIASLALSQSAFTCTNVGANTVTLTVTDVNGNVSTCTATVTVIDNTAPIAVCQGVTVNLNSSGTGTTTAVAVNNGSSDACGIQSLALSKTSFNCSNVGPNPVTLTVTDVNGNSSTCSTTVTVVDAIAPVALCKNTTVTLNASGTGSTTATAVNNGSSDACGIASTVLSKTSFNCTNVGANAVTLTVTDVNGNVNTCGATVTVIDNTAPVAVCQNVTVNLDATGNGSTTAAAVNNGSTDACGIASLALSQTAFTCANVSPAAPTDLIISEYVEGSGNNKYIEIYNGTATSKNLSNYQLSLYVNGSSSPTSAGTLSGTVAAGGTIVLRNSSAAIYGGATVSLSNLTYNGNDAVALRTSTGAFVDIIGRIGDDPGTQWVSGTNSTQDYTLRRKSSVTTGITVSPTGTGPGAFTTLATEWDGFPTDNVAGLGAHSISSGTPVVLTVTDVNGNVSTCNATVTVKDLIAPVAICQPVTVNLNSSGTGTTTATAVNNGSSDACGIASLALSKTSFNCSNVGPNPVTLTVTDVNGNVSTCATTVTVIDAIAPVALCKNATVTLNAAGTGSTTAAAVNNGSSDACGIQSLVLSQTAFTCSNVGANTVTLTVTDVNNNVSSCTATVTVIDNTAPVAVCQNVTVNLDATGNGSTTATAVNNGSSDACGIASLVLSKTAFNCSDISTAAAPTDLIISEYVEGSGNNKYIEIYNGTATSKNLSNYQLSLYVNGSSSPTSAGTLSGTVAAGGTIVLRNSSAAVYGGATVSLSNLTYNGNDAVALRTSTGAFVDIIGRIGDDPGTQWVSGTNSTQDYTLRRKSSVTTGITVSPTGTGPGAFTTLATEWDGFPTDNVAGLGSHTIAVGGANPVTLTVTDNNGNVSTCSAVVTVVDAVAPVALCNNVTVTLNAAGTGTTTATAVNNSSTDACGIASTVLSKTSFNCTNVGANTVTLTVTDVNGNASTCTATVTVVDNTAPIAVCQNVTVQLDVTGNGSTTATAVNNGSSDACGIASLVLSQTAFNCLEVGANPEILTVTDVNGNVSTCATTVTVVDGVAPVAICQDVTVNLNAAGTGSTTATAVNNGSSDACGISSLVLSQTEFNCIEVGANPVTLTVTDNNGNVSTCNAIVTVVDGIAPIALCKDVTVQLDVAGNGITNATAVDNGSSDACGIASLVLSQTNFVCSEVGANTETLTVTDVNGNVSTCTTIITVEDNVAPVATCQNVTVQLDNTGYGVTTAIAVNNGSTDACGLIPQCPPSGPMIACLSGLMLDKSTFDCSEVGQNIVTLTVTDQHYNSSQCTAIVTVVDNEAPIAVCQDVTVSLDAAGNGSTTATAVDNGSNDACGIASLVLSQTSFNCLEVGANSVTLTVTDVNGNVSSCIANVTVVDGVAPIAICQDVTIELDNTGSASTTATAVNNGSSDACGIASIVLSQTSFNCTEVGANTETLTVTDVNGNVSTCTTTVTVNDNISAGALCNDVTVSLDASGNGSTTAEEVDNGSSDACGIASLVLSQTSFNCSNVGPNPVILTVTDVNGNVSTCSATVTVEDEIAPIAICQNVTVNLDAAGNGSTTATAVNNGSNDACGIASLVLSNTAFTCTNVGANPVTLTVTDVNGNVSTCSAVVTVIDGIAPVAICQNVTVSLDASGNGSTTATAVNNGSSDACGIASLVLSNTAFTCTNVGSNPVTLTVTDVNGNVSTCNATVTVQDLIAPVALCQDVTVSLDASGNGSTTATAVNNGSNDACGIASTVLSKTSFNCSNVGSNPVTLTVTDNNGNVSTCSATVTVQDLIAPVAVCQDVTVSLDAAGTGSTTATAVNNGSNDACGIASLVLSKTSFNCSNVGSNPVILTVTDVNGNVSTCNATVTVQDLIAPIALCQNVTVSLDAAGNGSTTATAVNNGSSDACGIASTVLSKTSFNCSNVGSNPVILTVTDVNGNVSTCNATVTVQDLIAPIAICQAVTVSLNAAGNGSTTAAAVNNGSSDACGIASLVLSKTSFNCSNVGSNPVILTVTDVNGNISTCATTVIVRDLIAPIALCKNVIVNLNAAGTASTTAAAVNNGSSDACGIASLALSKAEFNCTNVGANPVTLTVTDVNSNVSTCTATVTVVDGIAPTALCKNATVTLSGGTVSITPSLINNGSFDNCGIKTLSVSPTSYNCSNIGNNTATLTVTDVNNNVSTCTSTITVVGAVPTCSISSVPVSTTYTGGNPNIIYLGYGSQSTRLVSTVSGGSGFTYSWTGSNLSSNSIFNPVFTPTSAGTYNFTVTITNSNGCVTTCSITICVVDIRVPGTGGKKVYVCHSGPPSTPNTLEISVNAVGAHLAHGDYLGICGGNNTICSGLPLKNPTATPSTSLTPGTPSSSIDLTARVSSIQVNAFPNPFKDNATISFTLPEFSNNVRLSIFNLAGEDVRLLYDGSAEANVEYQFKVNEDNTMESGLYFYRLQTKEGKMVVNKLILQK